MKVLLATVGDPDTEDRTAENEGRLAVPLVRAELRVAVVDSDEASELALGENLEEDSTAPDEVVG